MTKHPPKDNAVKPEGEFDKNYDYVNYPPKNDLKYEYGIDYTKEILNKEEEKYIKKSLKLNPNGITKNKEYLSMPDRKNYIVKP